MHLIDCFQISIHHPCLPGHFPGRPIVPGVVLLEQIETTLKKQFANWEITEIAHVKFLQPVLPEERIELHLNSSKLESHGSLVFQLIHSQTQARAASGKLTLLELNKR